MLVHVADYLVDEFGQGLYTIAKWLNLVDDILCRIVLQLDSLHIPLEPLQCIPLQLLKLVKISHFKLLIQILLHALIIFSLF